MKKLILTLLIILVISVPASPALRDISLGLLLILSLFKETSKWKRYSFSGGILLLFFAGFFWGTAHPDIIWFLKKWIKYFAGGICILILFKENYSDSRKWFLQLFILSSLIDLLWIPGGREGLFKAYNARGAWHLLMFGFYYGFFSVEENLLNPKWKYFALFGSGFGVLFSTSRSSILILIFFLIFMKIKEKKKITPFLYGCLGLFLFVFAYQKNLLPDLFYKRYLLNFYGVGIRKDFHIIFIHWIMKFPEQIIFGIGPLPTGEFFIQNQEWISKLQLIYSDSICRGEQQHFHSVFIQFIYYFGIWGICFAGYLFFLFIQELKKYCKRLPLSFYCIVLIFFLEGSGDNLLFDSSYRYTLMLLSVWHLLKKDFSYEVPEQEVSILCPTVQ